MIKSLHIRRIRSILYETAPMAALTIFVGPNGAGKSNFIRSIVLASRICRELGLLIDKKGPADDALRASSIRSHVKLEPFDSKEIYGYTSNPMARLELSLSNSALVGLVRLEYSPQWARREVRYRLQADVGDISQLAEEVASIRYISTDRLVHWDLDRHAAKGEEQELVRGEELIRALKRIARNRRKLEQLIDFGSRYFNVDWSAALEATDEMQFIDRAIGPAGVRLPFELSSLGTRQFFPIIVHTLELEPGGILLTEEPEISLHPAVQVATGEYFAGAAARGLQVVITTHSHYLLLGICKQIRAGNLPSADVSLLDCTKTRFGTKLKQLSIDASGRVEGWIPSFADVDEYLMREWISDIGEK